jgi:ketosteroid isomerase-like protein
VGNEEIARGFLAALNTGDKSEWDSVCDPEIEWTPPADWPEAGTIRGADAVWDFFVELNEPWEQGDYEIAEIINPADDKIAVLISREMRGKASGVIAEFAYWTIATFRDGRICRVQWFSRRDEAMEAAGA